jgi:hypothetical protein
MHTAKKSFLFLIFTCSLFLLEQVDLWAQKNKTETPVHPAATDTADEYYNDNFIRYENHSYKKSIRSIQLINKAAEMSSAMIRFNSTDQLRLGFDDLDGGFQNYSYTIIHCSADWKPSDLNYNEYVNGFTENPITDYGYSSALVLQPYTHYTLFFPDENMVILKPGNYILKVTQDNNPDNLVLTRRFMVYEENVVYIPASFKNGATLTDQLSKQGINFSVQYPGYDIRTPSDVQVMILQNGRWDNAITGIRPVFMRDKELSYEFTDTQNEFNGGSEFRNFDMKSIRYRSMHIANIKAIDNQNQVYLTDDEKRGQQRYSSAVDINGHYLVKITEGTNSDVEADYCYVHFFLPYPSPETESDIYVFGELTDWTCKKINKMKYNDIRKGYECVLYLKQGYYDYEYVILSDGSNVADDTVIEGSHFETENDYLILVYYRPPATTYDRLIAVKKMNSTKN